MATLRRSIFGGGAVDRVLRRRWGSSISIIPPAPAATMMLRRKTDPPIPTCIASSPPFRTALLSQRRGYTSPPPPPPPAPSSQAHATEASPHNQPHPPHPQTHSPPPAGETYYALFPSTLPHGPPPTGKFHIHPRQLRSEYLQLQQLIHPDLQHHRPHRPHRPHQPTLTSHHLQKAYSTLLDPLLRAEYILSLHHTTPSESPSDPHLLSIVLELNEALDEALDAGPEALEQLKSENDERINREEEYVGRMLEEARWDEAREGVERWRYWRSVGGRIDTGGRMEH